MIVIMQRVKRNQISIKETHVVEPQLVEDKTMMI